METHRVAVANAAKDKLAGMLAKRLRDDGVYVGQVTIAGTVKVPSAAARRASQYRRGEQPISLLKANPNALSDL